MRKIHHVRYLRNLRTSERLEGYGLYRLRKNP
jgi:hypothetical protein